MSFNLSASDPLSHVLPHPLLTREADLGDFFTPDGVITVLSNQIVMMIAAGLLLMIFFPLMVRKRRDDSEVGRLVPTGPANLLEAICEYLRSEVAEPALGVHTDRFIKYIWSVFFFILTMNLLGSIPLGTVTPVLLGKHIGGTPTTNIWITGTLATLTMVLMVFNGLRLGGKDYLAHFSPGPSWIAPMMVPLEILGTFAKVGALAIRLFAAMNAGHILLAVLLGLILTAGQSLGLVGLPVVAMIVIGSVAISLVEIFVAFLQAFIFTYLSTLFIGLSVNLHPDEHSEEAAHS